jgi:hypothetical protein
MKLTTFTSSKSQATDYYRSHRPIYKISFTKEVYTYYLPAGKSAVA